MYGGGLLAQRTVAPMSRSAFQSASGTLNARSLGRLATIPLQPMLPDESIPLQASATPIEAQPEESTVTHPTVTEPPRWAGRASRFLPVIGPVPKNVPPLDLSPEDSGASMVPIKQEVQEAKIEDPTPLKAASRAGRFAKYGAGEIPDDIPSDVFERHPSESELSDSADNASQSVSAPDVVDSKPVATTRRGRAGVFGAGDLSGVESRPSEDFDPEDANVGEARSQKTREREVSKPDSFIGLLDKVTPFADWAHGQAYQEGKSIRITGNAIRDLIPGNEYEFSGRYTSHAKYGEGFDVTLATPHIRPDRRSIEKFLARNFKDVGAKKAETFITKLLNEASDKDVALEEFRQKLLYAPWTIDLSSISKKAEFKSSDKASPVLEAVYRDLTTKLGGITGMRDNVLRLLAGHLLFSVAKKAADEGSETDGPIAMMDPLIVQKCWAELKDDPYGPISTIPGYGFTSADTINQALVHLPKNSPNRLKALTLYSLSEGCVGGGHVYLTKAQLVAAIKKIDPVVNTEVAIETALEQDLIVADDEFGDMRYYTKGLHDAEVTLAQCIKDLCKDSKPLSTLKEPELLLKISEACKKIPSLAKHGLDEFQTKALLGILTSKKRLHTLTAGPGCGKSAIMEVLSMVLAEEKFVFVGPTGKAAKVLHNRVSPSGRKASTIHSALKGGSRADFKVNSDEPLDGRALVGDETSMDDLELATSLLEAANSEMHVILLGDEKQLASVAPGQVLKDLVAIPDIDHHRLEKTHRNSGGILEVVKQVDEGVIDCVDRESVTFSHGLGEAHEDFHKIARTYVDSVSRNGFENVVLLMSVRKGDPQTPSWNTTYANEVLRNLCNNGAEKVPGTKFCVRDRIMIRVNMTVPRAGEELSEEDYEDEENTRGERVVNGDTGMITSYERDARNPRNGGAKIIRVKLDDGRLVDLPGGQTMEMMQLAYAGTVHSSQGSEYKHVIFVGTPGSSSFINQTMLFTGLSRAREKLDVYADDAVLKKIAKTLAPRRNSALVERVTGARPVDFPQPVPGGRAERFGAMRHAA